MTTRRSGDRPMDITRIAEDDLLLDRLGRGEQPAGGEDFAATLSAWRAALPDVGPPHDRLTEAALSAVRRTRRTTRWARGSLALVTAALLAGGGLTAAAQDAGPGSPLWPVTRLLYPDLADSRTSADTAAHFLTDVRAAIDDGRYDAASRLLDRAWALADQIDEPASADRLRADIAALRAEIAALQDPQVPDGPEGTGSGAESMLPNTPRPDTPRPPTSLPAPSQQVDSTGTGDPGTDTGPGLSSGPPSVVPSVAPSLPVESANPTALAPDLSVPPRR